MQQYGAVLDHYEANTRELNDSVLTLLHHIAGDCAQPDLLLHYPIVCKLSEISDSTSLAAVRYLTQFKVEFLEDK